MCPTWRLLLLLSGAGLVSAIEIFAPSAVEAVNGTAVKLKCTFRSSHPVSSQSVIVSWNFRPLNSKTEESVFHYQEVAYPPQSGRFKGHAVWSGDISRSDASITLQEVAPTFNGTYVCNVRNRPDVHGNNRETALSVVAEASLSEISILVIAVVGGCVLILILLGLFLAVKFFKRRSGGQDVEMRPQEPTKRKDPTVCKPEEAVHLYLVKETLQVESSDDEASEPSSGDDDDDDDDDEEEDDDDDDDDGGDDDDD